MKMKLMPSSPDVDLGEIEKRAKEILENKGVKGTKTERQPIAFGLNAIIILFTWPEEDNLEETEKKLRNIENLSSAEIIDMRRAL